MAAEEDNQAVMQQSLERAKSDFEHVLHVALRAKQLSAGIPCDRRAAIADALLLRNILTGLTINQALHPESIGGIPALAFPDWPSISSLARNILDAYLEMFSIAVRPIPTDEAEIRLLWWQWHEVKEKIRLRNAIGSNVGGRLAAQRDELKRKIKNHPLFQIIPDDLKKPFEAGKRPRRALLENNRDVAAQAGVLEEHFDVQYQITSQATHSQPLVVSLLQRFEPGDAEVNCLLRRALNAATAFLAFSVRDFARLCPDANAAIDSRFTEITELWAGVFATSFRSVNEP